MKDLCDIQADVEIYDIKKLDEAVSSIVEKTPFAVALPIFKMNFYETLYVSEALKKSLPETYIILGNSEASLYAEYILSNYKSVDYIVLGEGEITLKDLVSRLLNNDTLSDCKGIYYRKGKNIVATSPRELVADLDSLAFPERDFCSGSTGFLLLGSRGCQGCCTFCDASNIYKYNSKFEKVRQRSISNIVDEIVSLKGNLPYCYVRFLDATFDENIDGLFGRFDELYVELKKRQVNFQFAFYIRAEQICEECIQKFMLLKEVGLENIFIGIEACTNEELKIFGKRATVEDNIRAMDLLEHFNFINGRIGITTKIGLIPFHPYTTLESLRQIALFVGKYKPINIVSEMMNRLAISGSVSITKKIIKDGLLTQDVSKPITDEYCYRFADNRIENIYNDFVAIIKYLGLTNDTVPYKIITKYNAYKSFNSDFDNQYDIATIYKYYYYITDCVVNILITLTNLSEAGITDSIEFKCQVEEYKQKLEPIKQYLNISYMYLSKKLLAVDRLAYYN